jgi:hypothetical protein
MYLCDWKKREEITRIEPGTHARTELRVYAMARLTTLVSTIIYRNIYAPA